MGVGISRRVALVVRLLVCVRGLDLRGVRTCLLAGHRGSGWLLFHQRRASGYAVYTVAVSMWLCRLRKEGIPSKACIANTIS